ncbi:MAG: alpha/beta fold hydrolase [Anaerolineales bacterium]|nr:alpha/beta fold hydrolase [Anaerolineales bacterium]
MTINIHAEQPRLQVGTALEKASCAVILLHGRGSTAQTMVPLAQVINPGMAALLIPQAAENTWYPHSAFGPIEDNEPYLSSALARIATLVEELQSQGFADEQIVFGGFSQGACLASEYAARNATRYGGLFVLSGALIGPPGTRRDYPGSFAEMPVFIGGSDIDPWVSHDLIAETAAVFERMGAKVDFRTYPGIAHTVVQDEIDAVRDILANV